MRFSLLLMARRGGKYGGRKNKATSNKTADINPPPFPPPLSYMFIISTPKRLEKEEANSMLENLG